MVLAIEQRQVRAPFLVSGDDLEARMSCGFVLTPTSCSCGEEASTCARPILGRCS